MVNKTMFSWVELRSAAEVGLGIVERLNGDRTQSEFSGIAFGVALGFAANKKWDLAQFLFGLMGPEKAIAINNTL